MKESVKEDMTFLPSIMIINKQQIGLVKLARFYMGEIVFREGTKSIVFSMDSLQQDVRVRTLVDVFNVNSTMVLLSHFWNTKMVGAMSKRTMSEKYKLLGELMEEFYVVIKSENYGYHQSRPVDEHYDLPQVIYEG
jgi:hypothetical protein